MDLPNSEKNLEELRAATNVTIVPISAREGTGITDATALLRAMVEEIRSATSLPKEKEVDQFKALMHTSQYKKKK